MMRLKVEQVGKGLHPSEVVVSIRTRDGGIERLRVARQSLANDTIEIGGPLRAEGTSFLIELPRETQRGAWRVWVSRDQLSEQERLRA
jgi:hypothetical protein